MRHILFLTDNFPPEVNAPASRTFEHCREWVKAGYQVTIVTGVPNFPKGKVFDGYRNKLWQRETVAGIQVIRVWTYITANEGFILRIIDYLSFMLSSFIASFFIRNIDLVVGTSPQFFTVCSAYLVGLVKRIPWAFELRDIWPESIRAVGAINQGFAFNLLEKLELFLYKKADIIISVTNSFKNSLVSRGVDKNKIFVLTNGVDSTQFKPREKDKDLQKEYGLDGKFVSGYIGTHGLAHSLETILDAAGQLKDSPEHNQYRFVLLGDGAKKRTLQQRAEQENLDNVIFIDSVSKDQVVRYWSLLDASIIHLKKEVLFTTVIPSKLFECIGMAVPVLHGVMGESADIVESEDVGLLFEPQNSVALVRQLKKLATDKILTERLKLNGPIAAKKYDRKVLARQMLSLLEELIIEKTKDSKQLNS